MDCEGAFKTKTNTMSKHQQQLNIQGSDLVNLLLKNGLEEGLNALITTVINNALLVERRAFMNADPYERNSERNGQANGFKPRNYSTSTGELNLKMPQVRGADAPFHSSLLESASRCDGALKIAAAEMYIQGISTRKVTKIMETLCGFEISSTEVSRAAKELDVELEKWRARNLERIAYLFVDATYVKVRMNLKTAVGHFVSALSIAGASIYAQIRLSPVG
jgi:transposase-like protein